MLGRLQGPSSDGRRRLQRPAPDEDAKPAKERLLSAGAGHSSRRSCRAWLWRRQITRPRPRSRWSLSSVSSAAGDNPLIRAPAGLDGQRQPVQPPADARHRGGIVCSEGKVWLTGRRQVDEERHGRHGQRQRIKRRQVIRRRQRQRLGKMATLRSPRIRSAARLVARICRAGHARSRAATSAAAAPKRCSQLSSTSKVCRGRRHPSKRISNRVVGCKGRGDRGGQGRRHQGRIGQRSEIDPDHAIGEVVGDLSGDGQGQSGLAHATRSCERQQRDGRIEQEPAGRGELDLTANEGVRGMGREPSKGAEAEVVIADAPTVRVIVPRHSVPDCARHDPCHGASRESQKTVQPVEKGGRQ